MRPLGAYGSLRFAGPPGWRRIPPVTRGTMVLTAVGYLATIFNFVLMDALKADPGRILHGEVWRLVTYPIVNEGIIAVLFDLLLLWSFGSEMEPLWGSRGYAIFLLFATASAGVLGVGASLLLSRPAPVPAAALPMLPGGGYPQFFGFAAPLTALIMAWMWTAPHQPTNFFGVLPMTRTGFAILAVVIVGFGEIEHSHSIARLIFVLGGIPAAWLWVRRLRRRANPFTLRPPRFFRRRKFKVIRGDENERIH